MTDHSILEELRRIWRNATPDSISGDLDRARALVALAAPELRSEAEALQRSLERLERWLHDR